jgi:hypothetical protein
MSRPWAICVAILFVLFPVQSIHLAGTALTAQPLAVAHAQPASQPSVSHADQDTAQKHELPQLRTQFSRTYATRGGYEAKLYAGSVNYQDGSGAWQPIDNTLIPSTQPGYAYQNAANRYTLLLPADPSQTPITLRLGTSWLSLTPVGAAGPPHHHRRHRRLRPPRRHPLLYR